MGVRNLIKALASERGIELDDDELDQIGLADEDDGDQTPPADDVLSQELPGEAAGSVEIFLAADSTNVDKPAKEDGDLLWYPIIREGQWAVRPGQTGKKKRTPLKVIAGKSKNQRREIGLQDVVDAFDDQAIQHVTVPTSHNNSLLENTGFIDKLKIVKGEVMNQVTKKKEEVSVLLGGYRFTEPDVKGRVLRGTIANRSAGLLYDYVDTERGKTWPVVLEHVALTNKPWITGMVNFGRKLKGIEQGKLEVVGLSLSDEGPDETEYAESLSYELELSESDLDFLAQESADWSKEGSPNWLRQQVDQILRQKRDEKRQLARMAAGGTVPMDYDCGPFYQCREAKPGKALIADGYGDDSNYWAAPITVKDGAVELAEYAKWSALKKAFIPDERPDPPANQLPLDKISEPKKTRLQLAREARRTRGALLGSTDPNPREVVTQDMSDTDTKLSDLSPQAQKLIQDAEARAAAAEAKSDKFAEQIERLSGHVNKSVADDKIAWLSSDDGLGLSAARGFSGFLAEVRQVYLADDGEVAVQSDHFSETGNVEGELTLSQTFDRVFGALEKSITSKKALGELLSQPADAEVELDKDGNPVTPEAGTDAADVETPGKPGNGGPEIEKLSVDQKVDKIAELSPEVARVMGRRPTTTPAGGKS